MAVSLCLNFSSLTLSNNFWAWLASFRQSFQVQDIMLQSTKIACLVEF